MRRGDLVTVALSGDFGKPRPALIIQSDLFGETETLTVMLVSGTLVNAPLLRISLEPNDENGLQKVSQIMIDKVMTVRRERLGKVFGRVDDETMVSIARSLTVFFGLA